MHAGRVAPLVALALTVAALSGCSTGVQEADRAIFVNACAAATNGTQSACACAYDDLASGGGGSDQVIQETIDDLQKGSVPQRVTRAVARCTTPS
jgi:hypothetical protein